MIMNYTQIRGCSSVAEVVIMAIEEDKYLVLSYLLSWHCHLASLHISSWLPINSSGIFQKSLSICPKKGQKVAQKSPTSTKDNCSGKGLKIWLENLRIFCLILHMHLNLVVILLNSPSNYLYNRKNVKLRLSESMIFLVSKLAQFS
jgi:hypothetical protein